MREVVVIVRLRSKAGRGGLALPQVKDMIATVDGVADGQPDFGVYATLLAGDPQKGALARA